MPSATVVTQDCLAILEVAEISRLEKLRLEVHIRRARHCAFGREMSEDEARALLLHVCSGISRAMSIARGEAAGRLDPSFTTSKNYPCHRPAAARPK